jgi:hypothetical protein
MKFNGNYYEFIKKSFEIKVLCFIFECVPHLIRFILACV